MDENHPLKAANMPMAGCQEGALTIPSPEISDLSEEPPSPALAASLQMESGLTEATFVQAGQHNISMKPHAPGFGQVRFESPSPVSQGQMQLERRRQESKRQHSSRHTTAGRHSSTASSDILQRTKKPRPPKIGGLQCNVALMNCLTLETLV